MSSGADRMRAGGLEFSCLNSRHQVSADLSVTSLALGLSTFRFSEMVCLVGGFCFS